MVQEVCYIDVDVWGPQAENCRQYLQKGRSVLIEGRLKLDSWQDQTGVQRTKHSVVADRVLFLGQGAGAQDTSVDAGTQDEMYHEPVPQSLRGGDLVLNPHNKVEKDLMDQLEKAERKVKAARSVKEKGAVNLEDALSNVFGQSNDGELDFKDQPPFEDELPF
jgi:single stranded DNA-binding protein